LGCWKAFEERGLRFGAVAGSSIGALNGALVCQGDWDKARALWNELSEPLEFELDYGKLGKMAVTFAADLGFMLLPLPNVRALKVAKYVAAMGKMASKYGSIGALRRLGLFDVQGLKPLLEKNLDMAVVIEQDVSLYITACGEPKLMDPLGEGLWFKIQDQTEEDAWRIIAASMAVPFLFSAVEVNGRAYSDGGVAHWLPIEPLFKAGVKRMIAISIKADYSLDREEYPGVNILPIQPSKPLGRFPLGTFSFDKETINSWMDQGYDDALSALKNWAL
jgi:NTE family protein